MDFLKLVIADDEENIRNGLKNILDWESLGIKFCGAAANGKEAYQQIIDIQPDIVILDIKMPGLTGIQVIEKLSEYCNQKTFKMPAIIVLSGFPDFEYAQNAMNAGAKAYLLKPVDEDLLEKKVIEISEEINTYKNEKLGVLQSQDFIEQSYLIDLITDNPVFDKTLLPGTKFFEDVENSSFVCFYLSSARIPSTLKANISENLNTCFSFFTKVLVNYNNDIILFLKTTNETALNNSAARLYSEKSFSSFIAKSNMEKGLEGLKKAYEQACENSKYLFFFSDVLLVDEKAIENFKESQKQENELSEADFVQKLLFCIETYDKKKLDQYIDLMSKTFINLSLKETQIKKDVISILVNLRNCIIEKYPERDFKDNKNLDFVPELLESNSYRELLAHFSKITEDFLESFNFNTSDSMIVKVIAYIKSNFNQDLKLENLGELFNCNSAYLGKKFKRYTGIQFNTFLDNLRVEAAKEKILNTDLKIYQISKLVGYNNTDYFFMKFKKNTGLTPKEFKLKSGKNVDDE